MVRPAMQVFIPLLLLSRLPGATLVVEANGRADFSDIQAALDAASDGDLISVRPGTYSITIPIDFNRLHSPGSPGSKPMKELQVRAEGTPEDTVILLVQPLDPESASAVIFRSGEGARSVLEGFKVTGGSGSAIPDGGHGGGGVLCRNGSSPTIRRCIISGNSAPDSGAGVLCLEGSSPSFLECQVSGNGPVRSGGGVACGPEAAPVFVGCRIAGNRALETGGGIDAADGAPAFKACRISANRCGGTGGALSSRGGAAPLLVNCLLSGNIADGEGGGMSAEGSSAPGLVNCTVTGNLSLELDQGVPGIGVGGGILARDRSAPALLNSIVWGNIGGTLDVLELSVPRVTYSLVEGDTAWPGEGNLTGDPLFVLPAHLDDAGTPDDPLDGGWVEGDYHLISDSICIDAGSGVGAPIADIDGVTRPCLGAVDMGAYEAGPCSPAGIPFRRGDPNADGVPDLTDPIALLIFLFIGSWAPPCLPAADVDASDEVDIPDVVYILRYLFLDGEAPPEPFAACAPDASSGDLRCEDFAPCR